MKINIYYGGRGVIGDPTLYVLKKMTTVFEELNVTVERFDLYDQKNIIATLPQTIKEADAIVLASTVEWHGAGGYIYSFLDACWLYRDKDKIQNTYMAPVIMSTTYGEKEAQLDLIKAWATLGGAAAEGITGYIPDVAALENNSGYDELIEKCAENIYRAVSQKWTTLPVSNRVISQKINKTKTGFLTQQETEQLSEYISNEKFVTQQKADIKELASMFKGRMKTETASGDLQRYMDALKERFSPMADLHIRFKFFVKDMDKNIAIRVENADITVKEGDVSYPDVTLTIPEKTLRDVLAGKKTFQGAFMDSSLTAKGDFKNMRILDEIFPFMEENS